MRFSPRSTFLGVVALGLPFAVTAGWTAGTPAPAPAPASAPGGAGGIGTAPPKATTPTTSSVVDWRPRAPEPAVMEESPSPSLPGGSASVPPSGATPSVIVASGSADPTLSPPPAPTPTLVLTTPASPSATGPSRSAEPYASPSAQRDW